jgi:hypothetical protein
MGDCADRADSNGFFLIFHGFQAHAPRKIRVNPPDPFFHRIPKLLFRQIRFVGKKNLQRAQHLKKSFFLQKKMIFLNVALSTPFWRRDLFHKPYL